MVSISTPKYIVENSGNYAVLVQKVNVITGTTFYFVSSSQNGDLVGPSKSFKFGGEYATRALALANLPSGFSAYTPPAPVTLSIGLSVAIFDGVGIAVFGGTSPWTLQWSTNNGTTWNNGETRTTLAERSSPTDFPNSDGELRFSAPASGIYLFRVLSANLTSNTVSANVTLFGDTGGGGGGGTNQPIREGDFILTDEITIGNEVPSFNTYSLDVANMGYNLSRPRTARFPKGFALMTMAGQHPGPLGDPDVKFSNWAQSPIFFSGTENNVFKNGNKTYYYRPQGYDHDLSTNMFDFHRLFPAFQLPEGKLVVFEPGVGRRDTYPTQFDSTSGFSPLVADKPAHLAMISRGATHVKDIQDTNPRNTMKFLGDVWMLEVGYPSDGTAPLPDHSARVAQWAQNTTPQTCVNKWIEIHLNDPTSENYLGNVGYYMWNFELQQAWPAAAPSHFNSFLSLLVSYCEVNVPNLLVAVWRYAGAKLFNIGPNNFFAQYNYLLNNPQLTPIQVKSYMDSQLGSASFLYKDGFFNSKAVQQVGFYQVYLRSKENPLVFVFNYLYNKRLSPQSKVLGIFWGDVEGVPDADFILANITNTINGNTRVTAHKPRVGFSTMQTLAAWALFAMDGIHMWEVIKWNGNTQEFLVRSPFFGIPGGDALPNTFPYQTLKGYDWMMCGIWAVSMNKDIVDAPTPIVPINNNAWQLFSNDEFQDPAMAYKLSADGTKALVLVTDFTARTEEIRTHNITINGTVHQIKTFFRYTSVVRIDL